MLGRETVRLRLPAGTTPDGDPLPIAVPVEVESCLVEVLGGADLVELGRDGATGGVRVYMPITSGVTAQHDVEVRGRWYEIVGDPEPNLNDDPELSGYVLTCTRGEG
ncbi:head-to-tail stopper [Gordonia phage Ayotoya]|uniref:Head-to-tail connector protein n=7 Tax=Betterkatzvirus betterkatz TaxID=2560485 RepID=A0A2Z5HDB4_9CAUD|nr:head closure Hc1 [Gordonia phage BetterKatz]AXC38091.1 head-to-tail connector protein [Gordonia phage Nadeem]AZS11182.1 head-to-tail connector complex protein [Gordonia phage WheatThin]QAU06811.1 head-to-tail stopper [Gordonia phage Brylie]QAX92509.1 hypothetical protein SEA_MULCH_13 [Gordonia phage Mulch]QAY06470.1 head-to-tail stopper [Gordonia phage Parada]QPL13888.1 head-to-tail stopper [Gordonia phage NancyRae]QSL99876.1 head-to-tail stopper [Gordonia phage Ayotoya]QXO14154.1 head-t